LATTYSVGLEFSAKTRELDAAVSKLKGIEAAGTSAANGIKPIGSAAARSAVGVKTLGAAFNAALGPIGAAVAAIGGLSKAFQTLSAQNFAEAKVRTLGTDSAALVTELKKVSAELNGQASVAELTGAAYDVASAGFVKAADAAMVLKAASLGATGGFSDINTVGNAATSVLNAYGLAASEAGLVVDRFIQTQNDGKIVVAEYATNIGKVAAAAAGLGIPLEQVNAVIAQATASGVQADVAFTGLKSALARLASGEAAKELEGFGIKISAASIESDGLYGTLKKLEGLDTGTLFKVLGTEAAPALLPVIQNLERFDELIKKQEGSAGAAAAAQKEAANTIQGAWKEVSTAFQNLFSDQSELGIVIIATLKAAAVAVRIFGQTLNVLLAPIKNVITTFAGIASAVDKAFSIGGAVQQVKQTTDEIKEIFSNLGTTISAIWSGFIDELGVALNPLRESWDSLGQWMSEAWSSTTEFISGLWGSTTEFIGTNAEGLGSWIQGVWNGIASGAQNIIAPITNAFSSAFNAAMGIIQGFWNGLPAWLRGALSAAGSVAGAITGAVTNALGQVGGAIQKGITGAGKNGAGVKGPAAIAYKAPGGGGMTAPAGGGGGGGKKGGGGGKKGGGGGAATRESQVPQLTAELALKQRLFQLETQIKEAQLAGDKLKETALQREIINEQRAAKVAEIERAKLPDAEKKLKAQLAELDAKEKIAELDFKIAEKENDRKKRLEDLLTGFDREIELAGAKTEEAKKLLEIEHKILDLKKDGLLTTEAEIAAYRAKAQAAAAAAGASKKGKIEEYTEKLKTELGDTEGMVVSLARTIEGEIGSAMSNAITGLIDGTMTAQEAFSQMFKNIGKAFIDMATQMIAKAIVMKILGIAFGGGGGGSWGGSGGSSWGGFSGALQMPKLYADGGFVTGPTNAVIGEGGESEYVIPASKMSAAMSNYSAGRRGAGVLEGGSSGAAGGGGGAGGGTFTLETVVINRQEYATIEQVRAMGQAAAKQGAEGGHSRVMGDFRNKRSVRSRVGMR
jgi:TP901 family phage tail tape measure protein